MSPSADEISTGRPDWRGWMALAWMVGFGLLYVAMLVREKAPGLLARVGMG